MNLLTTLTELSHEFGHPGYVLGGGGNTSAKDARTLWVKPSGTTLAGITSEGFVALDRRKLQAVHEVEPPDDPTAREAMVKERMMAAVFPGQAGRPSVEAPLHDSFAATFVVHTHPARVNGLTCAKAGREACRELFPDALWVDYVDPGFVLSCRIRREISNCRATRGREPQAVFLQNHGLIVAGNSPEDVRHTYQHIMTVLENRYRQAGLSIEPPVGAAPSADAVAAMTRRLQELIGKEHAAFVSAGPTADVFDGPLSPDHVVYARSYALCGEPTEQTVAAFRQAHGYLPAVVACAAGTFGAGATQKKADLALDFALDAAQIKHLAQAFGGVQYLDDRARNFIENWEVEVYRSKQL